MWSRLVALERLVERQSARIAALEARLAAQEQSGAQNWASQSWVPAGAAAGAGNSGTTPSGGIPAGGSATCTLAGGGSDTVYNDFTTAIGGNKKFVYIYRDDGTNHKLFVSEDC